MTQIAAEGQQAIDDALRAIFSDQFDQVEQYLDRAEASSVGRGRVTLLRGMAAHHLNKDTEALKLLKSADAQLEDSMAAKVLLEWTYLRLGDTEKSIEIRKAYMKMSPRRPEDYLYAGLGFTDTDYDLAIELLEELAESYPLPRVLYFLGRAHDWKLTNTYSVAGIDRTIQVVNAAHAMLPHDLAALRRHAGAHMTAADIYRMQGMEDTSQYHLGEAKKTADYVLRRHPDVAMTYQINADSAAFEGKWEIAVAHAREANERSEGFDDLAALAPLLYREGKAAEAIDAFDRLPDGIKSLCGVDCVLYVAERGGIDQAIASYDEWFREVKSDHIESGVEYVYSTFAILGLLDEAEKRSAEYLERVGPPLETDNFTIARDDFTRGKIGIDQLIGAAESRFDRMEAHFLKGCSHLARRDREAAVRGFQMVENEGAATWGIYMEDAGRRAAVLLHRMREDHAWPPWLD